MWVAQNRLAAAQVATPWPALGNYATARRRRPAPRFVWRESVTATPNPAFRKIEITVSDPGAPDYALARISGYLGQPPQR